MGLVKGGSVVSEVYSIEKRRVVFVEVLKGVLPTRNQSDRTCLYRVGKFLVKRCDDGRSDETAVFREVLGWAESIAADKKAGTVRNGWAVFMSMMRKELGYGSDK